jgi:hypothetical protein
MRLSKLAARVWRMSAHEIGYRLRQEIWKRADAARAPRPEPLDESAPRGRFFFDDPRERLAQVPKDCIEACLEQAAKVLRHRFDVLGYQDLDFGREIDWRLDPVAGIRAPREPWHRIRFLDHAVAGDHKVVWELNRHQHLVTLAKAHLYTGDRRFLDEIVIQWRHWMRENPYPIGINWASSLEVAFRSLSWIWVLHLVPAPREMVRELGFNARFIEKYLSLYFAPNTHLLGEAVALFFIGTLFPGFRRARRWRVLGWRTILDQIASQVRPDGMHFEQSVYYHVYALDFFRHARELAIRNGLKDERLDDAIERMSGLLEGISRGGLPPRFGDDDGGRLFDPRRNRAGHMLDPISVTEESIWLGGGRASARAGVQPRQSFEHAGLYTMTHSGRQIIIDAGPHGTGNGGHGHADALSLQWIAGGREWL